jgi:signal transduction histidine kinase
MEYSRDINESGVHLLDIINDILDLSKAEAGKLSLTYEEVHVGKSISKCVTILSERAAKGGVEIRTQVPKIMPALVADRLRFIQVLLNIMSNAVKFTHEGGVVDVSVHLVETQGEVSHFVIVVQDSGIGMSQGDIEKAFQSFGQVDSGLNRKYEGTGLGLPLTKKLLELHQGTIQIESELGRGTRVTLTLPALPPSGLDYQLADV